MNDTNTPNPEHPLGLDYTEIPDLELRELIENAEIEWIQNAHETYGRDTPDIWANDIFPRLASGHLEDVDLEDLRRYCPEFLRQLSQLKVTEVAK